LRDVRVDASESYSVALVASLTWLAGAALRQRTVRAAQAEERTAALEREHRDAQVAVADERARIARELHDVVAHSVSVMTVQAGAARMLLNTDPSQAVAPLLAVEETGRQAMTELRRLLGILRPDDDSIDIAPQPGLDDLPALVDTVSEAGLQVEMRAGGTIRPLAPGVGLAAYRIVQEALTNSLRHAEAKHVRVCVDYGTEELHLEVRDDGQGQQSAHHGHGVYHGRGLAGMRERAVVYGGELEAGPEPGGGYAVRASLPIERISS
jgi:signal transduction histidine kinase